MKNKSAMFLDPQAANKIIKPPLLQSEANSAIIDGIIRLDLSYDPKKV